MLYSAISFLTQLFVALFLAAGVLSSIAFILIAVKQKEDSDTPPFIR